MDNHSWLSASSLIAAFTGLTVVSTLVAGMWGWVTGRPKVTTPKVLASSWQYYYSDTDHQTIEKTTIWLNLLLRNEGEGTALVKIEFSPNNRKWLFDDSDTPFRLVGKSAGPVQAFLQMPASKGVPDKDVALHGVLSVTPLDNQRLFLWGKRRYQMSLIIPFGVRS